MRFPQPNLRAIGTAFLIAMLSASVSPGLLLAQDEPPGGQSVNQGVSIDPASFRPFEVEYESIADDGRRLLTTVSYELDSQSGPEPLIRRRWDEEYISWSDGYPKKNRHYSVESTARAADLEPVRTNVVNQYWNDAAATWVTERWIISYTPGRATRHQVGSDTTTLEEIDLPYGILQGPMVSLAIALRPDPPQELVVTSYNWLNNRIDAWQYDTLERDSVAVAGRDYEAIVVQVSDPETGDVATPNYYRAALPRVFLGSTDPESSVKVTSIREGS